MAEYHRTIRELFFVAEAELKVLRTQVRQLKTELQPLEERVRRLEKLYDALTDASRWSDGLDNKLAATEQQP